MINKWLYIFFVIFLTFDVFIAQSQEIKNKKNPLESINEADKKLLEVKNSIDSIIAKKPDSTKGKFNDLNKSLDKLREGTQRLKQGLQCANDNNNLIKENNIKPKIVKKKNAEYHYFFKNDTLLKTRIYIEQKKYNQQYRYYYKKNSLYFVELNQFNKKPKKTITIKGNCCYDGELIFSGFAKNKNRSEHILNLEKKSLKYLNN